MSTATQLLTEVPPLMTASCDPSSRRYDLKIPFVEGAYLWATDGRTLVRQPLEDFEPSLIKRLSAGRGRYPKALWTWDFYDVCGGEWDDIPPPIRIQCDECKGIERTKCYSCHGVRYELDDKPVPVGSVNLGSFYAERLYSHGVRSVQVQGPSDPVRFSLGRLEGILLPLKPESEREG